MPSKTKQNKQNKKINFISEEGINKSSKKVENLHIPQEEIIGGDDLNLLKQNTVNIKSFKKKKSNKPVKMHIPSEDVDDLGVSINLAPQKILEISHNDILKVSLILFSSIFLGILIIGISYFVLDKKIVKAKKKYTDIKYKISNIQKDISLYEKDKEEAEKLQLHLALTNKLLEDHIYMTNFFKFLEDITLPDVYYKSVAIDQNKVSLQIFAKDYSIMAQQIKNFQTNNQVISVLTSRLDLSDDPAAKIQRKLVATNLTLVLDPTIFKYQQYK